MHRYRTHTCGALGLGQEGEAVRLSGWCHRIRDHGGVLFMDLRDHYGVTQCVVDPDLPAFHEAEKLRSEFVIRVDGTVRKRPPGTENPEMATGLVEVYVREIEVLGPAGDLPMPVFGDQPYPEDIRLKYRFLDLRREKLHENIMLRGRIIDSLRARMKAQGFFEFQTPILTASSPEGARDFLVPSRLHPGKFYALPQAPQQFKQLTMVAGFDRYFQIAPCFRDEDARADRSPGEFYQLDVEMSFVTQEDVFAAVEPVLRGVFEEFGAGRPVTQTFLRISYADAMRKYGSDKPDLRNPIVMQDVSECFRGSGFKVFARMLETPETEVWAIPALGGGQRTFADRMNSWAQSEGQPGLGYIFWRPKQGLKADEEHVRLTKTLPADIIQEAKSVSRRQDFAALGSELYDIDRNAIRFFVRDLQGKGMTSDAAFWFARYFEAAGPIATNIGPQRVEAIRQQLHLTAGDAAFFVAGDPRKFAKFAGAARNRVGQDLDLIRKDVFEFCWIVDFPMYEWNEEEKRIDFSHNPFSMPNYPPEAFLQLQTGGRSQIVGFDEGDRNRDLNEDGRYRREILSIKAFQYDIVCNGVELSSGAIRNHRPDIMRKAFEIAGYGEDVLLQKFGGMYRAFQCGAPPHGGIAPGVDRIVMLLAGEENLREVVLFPMNQRAEDLMMGAPLR